MQVEQGEEEEGEQEGRAMAERGILAFGGDEKESNGDAAMAFASPL
jgi:hypothetical protein